MRNRGELIRIGMRMIGTLFMQNSERTLKKIKRSK